MSPVPDQIRGTQPGAGGTIKYSKEIVRIDLVHNTNPNFSCATGCFILERESGMLIAPLVSS